MPKSDVSGEADQRLEWISERHVALATVAAEAGKLRPGLRLLCVWLDGQAYSCQLLGGAAKARLAVQFEDGLRYDAEEEMLHTFLEEPLFPEAAMQPLEDVHGRSRLAGARPLERSRAAARQEWAADSAQRGPLQRVMSSFDGAWRGLDAFAASSGARVERDAGGVPGLHVCRDFLNEDEVRWLRRLFSAHQGWAMYNWGSVGKNGGVGKNGDLASMLERIAAGSMPSHPV